MIKNHHTYALGQTLQYLRKSRNITQKDVKNQLSFFADIARIESGKIEPKFQLVMEYLSIIGVSFEEFYTLYQKALALNIRDFSSFLRKNYGSVSSEQFQQLKSSYEKTNIDDPTIFEKMVIHKFCIYYHLYFTHDLQEGQRHADVISDYLYSQVEFSLYSDIDLSISLYPFSNVDQATYLYIRTTRLLDGENNEEADDLKLRATLNYLKALLKSKKYQDMLQYFDTIALLVKRNTLPIYRAEEKILKAIVFTELSIENNSSITDGVKMIQQALNLAKKENLTLFHQHWEKYCQQYTN